MAARDGLNYSQFTRMAEFANYDPKGYGGGFSRKAYGDVGAKAKDAYMVADEEHEQMTPKPVTADHLMRFAEDKSGPLHEQNAYMGAWVPSNESRGTLDVSRAYQKSDPSSLGRAKVAGWSHHQKAIGEVDAEGDYMGDVKPLGFTPQIKGAFSALFKH